MDNGKQQSFDPQKTVVGIVTMEDIIEELIQDEIEDEYERNEEMNKRNLMKEKLVAYYTDSRAANEISEQEFRAILEYLEKYVKPF